VCVGRRRGRGEEKVVNRTRRGYICSPEEKHHTSLKTVKQQINLQMNDNEPLYLFVCCSPYSIDFDFLCKLLHHTISISKKKKLLMKEKTLHLASKQMHPKIEKKKKGSRRSNKTTTKSQKPKSKERLRGP
jgi:translation initiation factor 2 beta subunit (eIF-2beta)/eIF-5